ncbi:hypothetical protein ACJX0J_035243, partial [Zea mays]
ITFFLPHLILFFVEYMLNLYASMLVPHDPPLVTMYHFLYWRSNRATISKIFERELGHAPYIFQDI